MAANQESPRRNGAYANRIRTAEASAISSKLYTMSQALAREQPCAYHALRRILRDEAAWKVLATEAAAEHEGVRQEAILQYLQHWCSRAPADYPPADQAPFGSFDRRFFTALARKLAAGGVPRVEQPAKRPRRAPRDVPMQAWPPNYPERKELHSGQIGRLPIHGDGELPAAPAATRAAATSNGHIPRRLDQRKYGIPFGTIADEEEKPTLTLRQIFEAGPCGEVVRVPQHLLARLLRWTREEGGWAVSSTRVLLDSTDDATRRPMVSGTRLQAITCSNSRFLTLCIVTTHDDGFGEEELVVREAHGSQLAAALGFPYGTRIHRAMTLPQAGRALGQIAAGDASRMVLSLLPQARTRPSRASSSRPGGWPV